MKSIQSFLRKSFISLTELEVLHVKACGLRTIDLGAFNGLTYLTELKIEGNEISEIIPGTFENMNSLEYLFLNNNGIQHVESALFSGLVKLKHISLHQNELQYLHPDTFLRLPKLQQLHLSNNPTLLIPTDSNLINSHSLSHLDISYCNVSSVSVDTFANVSALEWLDLRYNRLERLDSVVFSGLLNLKEIYLSGNNLQYLHPDTFLRLSNLQMLHLEENWALQIPTDRHFINSYSLSHLDISNCNVSSVSVETFTNVSALKLLDLSDNNMRTVDINILRALPKLSTFYLYGNPLQCDCQLQEVWRWCKDRNMWTGYVGCDTPSEMKGKQWWLLEKGKCLEGNMQYYGDYKNTSYS
jgi:Leucine-rich repeat (LRR) protein